MGMKGGVSETAKKFNLPAHYVRKRARAGEIPFLKSGNKYIFDWDLLEEFLRNEALGNVKQEENTIEYGKLRKLY